MVKVFEFGNGGVLVHKCYINGIVEFKRIKPPLGYVGRIKKGDLEGVEELYTVRLTRKNDKSLMEKIRNDLKSVNESTVLEYDGFVLDLSDFKIESVNIAIRAIDQALNGYSQLSLAC